MAEKNLYEVYTMANKITERDIYNSMIAGTIDAETLENVEQHARAISIDYLALDPEDGYDDLYEQICLDTLNNVDYIAVITMDMDRHQLDIYKEYQKLFPDKIYLYSSPIEFEVRLK